MSERLHGGGPVCEGQGLGGRLPGPLDFKFKSAISSVPGASFHFHCPRPGLVHRRQVEGALFASGAKSMKIRVMPVSNSRLAL